MSKSKCERPIRTRQTTFICRAALLAGAAALFVIGPAGTADAQFWSPFQYRPYAPSNRYEAPTRDYRSYQDTTRRSHRSAAERPKSKKDVPIKHPFGENMPKGPLQLIVSIGDQRAVLYSNGVRVGETRVSTGNASYPTPTGVFSVIQKNRWHRSNIYDNAPMYYMHRLTWSGVALHEGHLPGYAASHGCIRMPTEFVSRLWNASRLGMRVVIARVELTPRDFAHEKLFNPAPKPVDTTSTSEEPGALRSSLDTTGSGLVRVAETQPAASDSAVGSDAPNAGQAPAPAAAAPAAAPENADPGKPAFDPNEVTLPRPAPLRARGAEPAKKNGQVAVFISGKEKRIYVRQAFVPVFDMAIEIANPGKPLGTHTFTALETVDGGARMRWNLVSMPLTAGHPAMPVGKKAASQQSQRPKFVRGAVITSESSSAADALDRVTIPQEAIERISELLTPGSSMIISDEGLGRETGRYTEFIVETR